MRITKYLIACALLEYFVCSTAGAQSLQKMRVGYPSISSRQAQLWIAKDEGLFRKYGLDVELIFLRGGQVAIQALTGGDPPLVTIGNVIIANLQGHDIVLVGSVENSYDQVVFAKPEQFVDLTFLQELEAEKYFDEMARRYK